MQGTRSKTITLSLAPANTDASQNATFVAKEVSVDNLHSVLTSHNYSNLQWHSGQRRTVNFDKTEVVIIDIDNGMTINEARKVLRESGISHAIITTKRHTETQNRFRLVVFINRPILSIDDYKRIVTEIRDNRFPAWDPNTLDGAHFYYSSPQDAFFELWLDGKDYDVDIDPVTLNMREFVNRSFESTLRIRQADGVVVSVSEIKNKTSIYCPFHEDKNASAFLDYSENSKNSYIRCSACGKTFWMRREPIPIEETLDSFWSVGKSIFQFVIQENEFISSELGKDKFFIMTEAIEKTEKDRVFASLVDTKHMPVLRRVNYLGDPTVDRTAFRVSPESGCVDVSVGPAPANVTDNAFVDRFLKDRFGAEAFAIKNWLAVFAHSNYQKLPILIVTGKRGSGKNTFAEMVMAMYPSLSQFWRGYLANFTDEVEKKLLVADEAFSDNPVHYSHLKSLIGASEHVVNKKYQTPYQVRNNLNIIILSNSKIPIYVNPSELPTSDRNNQFLVVEFRPLQGSIDANLGQKLSDRIGYYIRTELKRHFEQMVFQGYRYSIPVPITEAEISLFKNNGNEIDDAAATVVENLKMLMTDVAYNPNGSIDPTARTFVKENGLLPVAWVQWQLRDHRFEASKILKRLVDMEIFPALSKRRTQINNCREVCYELTARFREELKAPVGVFQAE